MRWFLITAVLWLATFKCQTVSTQRVRQKLPRLSAVPVTSFQCRHRAPGYYADMEANCQSYHMCDGLRQFSYLCPHETLFHQKFMVCDHHVAVNCSTSDQFYNLNLKIGKRNNENDQSISSNAISTTKRKKPIRQKTTFPSLPKLNPTKLSSRSLKIDSNDRKSSVPSNKINFPSKNSRQHSSISVARNNTKSQSLSRTFRPILVKNSPTVLSKSKPKKPIFKIGGRGGQKISFKVKSESKTKPALRPLVIRPRNNFEQISFTVRPPVQSTTRQSDTSDEEDEIDTNVIFNSTFSIPDILLPPAPSQPEVNDQILSRFLVPPFETPVILRGENQELMTPLSLSRFRLHDSKKPLSRFDLHLSSLRGNPAFYIPEPGLVPPLPETSNEILENRVLSDDGHSMTMTFTDRRGNSRTLFLPFNTRCPRCHPAFLRPNKCEPCVIIK